MARPSQLVLDRLKISLICLLDHERNDTLTMIARLRSGEGVQDAKECFFFLAGLGYEDYTEEAKKEYLAPKPEDAETIWGNMVLRAKEIRACDCPTCQAVVKAVDAVIAKRLGLLADPGTPPDLQGDNLAVNSEAPHPPGQGQPAD